MEGTCTAEHAAQNLGRLPVKAGKGNVVKIQFTCFCMLYHNLKSVRLLAIRPYFSVFDIIIVIIRRICQA